MGYIRIEEALKIIDSGSVCSIKYVSFDRRRKKGGKLKYLPEAVVTKPKEAKSTERSESITRSEKKPSHFDNSTRNFFECVGGRVTQSFKKVHVFLILELNGRKVML